MRRRLPNEARFLLGLHATAIVGLAAFFLVTELTLAEDDGANIGGGFALVLLAFLSLPWILVVALLPGYDGPVLPSHVGVFLGSLVLVAMAAINLGLHYLVWRRAAQRQLRAGGSTG